MKPIIEMKEIEKHFGSVIALAGVTIDFYPGECHCLLGDNGAGKSTFIKTMSGVHKPTSGEIRFEGKPMNFDDPRDSIAAGIATVGWSPSSPVVSIGKIGRGCQMPHQGHMIL